MVFTKTKIKIKKIYYILLIVPILSLLLLWTNDWHHLFYKTYSVYLNDTLSGPYMAVHTIYSYGLLLFAILNLIKFSIKNAGFFSKQSLLLIARNYNSSYNKCFRDF